MSTINSMQAAVVKIEVTVTEDNLHDSVRRILAQIWPEWVASGGGDDRVLESRVLTGGITNQIIGFFLRGRPDDMVIFKIYGSGTDSIIDREKEIQTMILLNRHGLGARLYALFANGIAYEYIPGATLNMTSCHQPDVYALVAAKMGRLHSVPLEEAPGPAGPEPFIWDVIDKFTRLASEAFARDQKLEADFATIGVTLDWARRDAAELRALCEAEPMPVVFTHNDLLLGNIIYNSSANAGPEVAFIDFEYSGPNYAPYDVANHFNEFSGVEPDEIDYGNYPSEETKSEWIRIYLQHLKSVDFDQPTFERWVTLCTPLSHLTWLVWCVVQAASSKLGFDYMGYARARFPQYAKDVAAVRGLFQPKPNQ